MTELDDIVFDPYGFKPLGIAPDYVAAPALCACGVMAQYASQRFGFLCAPCFRTWKATHA